MRVGLTGGLIVLVSLALIDASHASIKIAEDTKNPTLRVARSGVAEIGWTTAGGRRRHAIVLRNGTVRWGTRLGARNVSRPSQSVKLPFSVVVRETPDGRLWALQAWRRLRSGPIELMFSRWRGAPMRLTLSAR